MILPTFAILDGCLVASEITLVLSRGSGRGHKVADGGSLQVLWVVISLAVTADHLLALSGVGPYLAPLRIWRWAGIALFVAGLLLRRWAIRHLGRFFTVDVAIASDHRVVADGPYRLMRHPSYSGLLLEFAGLGLTLGSITGWLVMMVPVLLALLRRVRIEEAALVGALGEPYAAYMRRTKQFVPGVV